MIRLKRPAEPLHLVLWTAPATAELWTTFQIGGVPHVKDTVYNAKGVKDALRSAQADKCAFCETKDVRSYGAVEHFRPKHGWKQSKAEPLTRPGYFWLGYEWSNLLFACTMCNDAGHKGNLFPLDDPTKRATPHSPSIAAEVPLLINPYEVDPDLHIEWNSHIPKPKSGSSMGQMTIATFGLVQDQTLIDARRDYLSTVSMWVDLAEKELPNSSWRVKLKQTLLTRLGHSAEYAAMIREALGARIRAL